MQPLPGNALAWLYAQNFIFPDGASLTWIVSHHNIWWFFSDKAAHIVAVSRYAVSRAGLPWAARRRCARETDTPEQAALQTGALRQVRKLEEN
jgi:hypothetical protein